ncbi:MAG TPA: chemotaxis protein CheX [Terracidiphilus sp.]|nr:chemotaxis protein CheX [Terracidiphilus sp.]
MAQSLRKSIHVVADPKNLDASVDEVFKTMLGIDCQRDPVVLSTPTLGGPGTVTAVIGFGGLLSGACVLQCRSEAAMLIAAQMTGMEFQEIDDTVKDGVGEICNMLAGAWKSKVPGLAAGCGLSVPAVITGHDYDLHVQAPEFELRHSYRFGDASFTVTIVCDGIQ